MQPEPAKELEEDEMDEEEDEPSTSGANAKAVRHALLHLVYTAPPLLNQALLDVQGRPVLHPESQQSGLAKSALRTCVYLGI